MANKNNFKSHSFLRSRINNRIVLLFMLIGMVVGCASNRFNTTEYKEPPPGTSVDDLLVTDCLLPGQTIGIGEHQDWLSPPRPARIPTWECKLQGGQYVKSGNAISIWQDSANQGDKEAQNYVGEIFLTGLGIAPDYARAAEWFRKSAEQGFTRAENNLGYLYEKGLGVPKDPQTALKYYREANGLVEPINLDQATKDEINALRTKLARVEQEANALQAKYDENKQRLQQKEEELDTLKKQGIPKNKLIDLQQELEKTRLINKELSKQLLESKKDREQFRGQVASTENSKALSNNSFKGRYFALIIGINDYQDPGLQLLKTPVNDAKGIDKVLSEKYGFKTFLLTDNQATKEAIFEKLLFLKKLLTDDDNLLIYYAGHGTKENNSYHWLPYDAKKNYEWSMISSDDLTRQIEKTDNSETVKAKHVLIISDSCFAGVYGNNPTTRGNIIDSSSTSTSDRLGWINKKYSLVSRTLLASGGDEPVLDTESKDGQSIFANDLITLLNNNDGIIGGDDIYQNIGPDVESKVRKLGYDQAPVYRPIPGGGDAFGEFFFVPRAEQRQASLQIDTKPLTIVATR